MAIGNGAGPGQGEQQAVGQLLKQLSDQTRRLAQQELELAKIELTGKAKAAAVGGGLLGAAGLLGLLALLTLTAAAILALATAVAGWLAALIVTAVYGAAAAALALAGRARMAKAAPLAPTQAIESVKEDVSWLKTRAKFART
jgi:uncharacterized membrane protein YqjE